MSTTTKSDSAGNIIGALLKYGVENKMIIEKYLNMNAIENDTFTLLLGWESNESLCELATQLCKMWFPAGFAIICVSGSKWPNTWKAEDDIKEMLQKEGYVGLEDDDE